MFTKASTTGNDANDWFILQDVAKSTAKDTDLVHYHAQTKDRIGLSAITRLAGSSFTLIGSDGTMRTTELSISAG